MLVGVVTLANLVGVADSVRPVAHQHGCSLVAGRHARSNESHYRACQPGAGRKTRLGHAAALCEGSKPPESTSMYTVHRYLLPSTYVRVVVGLAEFCVSHHRQLDKAHGQSNAVVHGRTALETLRRSQA